MSTHSASIRLAYVQAQGGVLADESTFKAWDGFRKRGVPCELFDPRQVYRGELPLARDTLVAGGVPVVEMLRRPTHPDPALLAHPAHPAQ